MQSNLTLSYAGDDARRAFTQFCHRTGTVQFDYGPLDARLQGIYATPHEAAYLLAEAFCNRLGTDKHRRKTVIEYVANPEFQGFASSSGGRHVVALSAALPALIQSVFQYLVATTTPFAPGRSRPRQADDAHYAFPLELDLGSQGSLNGSIAEVLRATLPAERRPRVVACSLAQIAIVFCFAHEWAHLVLGHAEIQAERVGSPLSEFRRVGCGTGIGRHVSQAWEIQADQTAFAMVFSYVIKSAGPRAAFARDLRCASGKTQTLNLMGRAMYAISVVFFLIGQREAEVRTRHGHPSALTRVTYLIAFAQAILLRADDQYAEAQVSRAMLAAHERAERAWNQLGFRFGLDGYYAEIGSLHRATQRIERCREALDKVFARRRWAVSESLRSAGGRPHTATT